MSSSRRALHQFSKLFSRRRRKALRPRGLIQAEFLEQRQVMAGDANPFHNYIYAQDVNFDFKATPLDALLIINELNAGGPRQLSMNQSGGSGEGNSSNTLVDVNGDGYITPLDALQVINHLNASGAGPTVVTFQTLLVGEDGQYLAPSGGSGTIDDPWQYTLSKDDRYGVSIMMKDNRPSEAPGFNNDPLGIFASYVDITYDATKTKLGFEEVQQFTINWTSGSAGKLDISVPGLGSTNPATPVIISRANAEVTRANIETALNTLSGSPDNKVFSVTNAGDTFFVKFLGDYVDRDAPQVAISRNASTTSNGSFTVANDGTIFSPATANTALLAHMDQAMNFNRLYDPVEEQDFPERHFEVFANNAIIRAGAIAVGDYLSDGGTDYQTDRQFDNDNLDQIDTEGFIEFMRPWFVANAPTSSSNPLIIGINPPGNPDDNEFDSVSATLLIADVQGFEPKVPRSLIDFGAPIEIIISADVTANADAVSTPEDTAIPSIDVIKLGSPAGTAGKDVNNVGPDANLTITGLGPNGNQTSFTIPNQGTVTLTGQTISFAPAQDFFGQFVFQYGLSDVAASTTPKDVGTVTITVNETNDPPVGVADTVPLNEDAGATDITAILLANDTTGPDPSGASGDNLVITQVNGAASANTAKGTVSVVGGVVTYTPNANATGSDSFTYTLSDGRPGGIVTDIAVTVNIAAINDPPSFTIADTTPPAVAEDSAAQTVDPFVTAINPGPADAVPPESGSVTFTLTPVNVPSTLTFTTTPTISSTGVLTYHAAPNAYGTATYNVTASDGTATSAPVLITIEVTPVNDAPDFTIPATFQSNEGASVAATNFITNISAGINEGTSGVTFTINVVSPPASLTFATPITINAQGQISYVPTTNAFGTAVVEVTAHDNGNPDLTVTKSFTLTIVEANDAPDAVDDPTGLEAPDGETNAFLDVLANDSSAPDIGAPGEVLLVDPAVPLQFLDPVPAGVTVTALSDGSGLQVTSPLGLITGSLRVRYTIRDRAIGQTGSLSDSAVATINFVSAALPRAIPDTFPNATFPTPIAEDNGVFTTLNVLNNDRRFNTTSGVLTITGIRFPGQTDFESVRGTIITDADGNQFRIAADGLSLEFQPGANVFGAVNVQYRVEETPDAGDGPSIGAVVVNVTEVNDNPVANPDTVPLQEDAGPTNITSILLGNDNADDDPTSGDPGTFDVLKVTAVNGSTLTLGTVNVDANGVVTYTPNANASGTDTFTYTLSDGRGGTANATVTVDIAAVNDPPSFTLGNATRDEDAGAVSIPNFASNILPGPANSVPAETGTVTFSTPTQLTSSSTLTFQTPPSIAPDGTLTFQAAANAFGIATFSVTATDNGGATSAAQTFTITINEVNDNPVATNDNVTVVEDSGANNITATLLGNDNAGPDPTSGTAGTFDVLTITAASGATKGTVTVNAGVVTYTPNANASGSDSFTYTLSDGRGGTATATANITITEVNDPPTFTLDANITRPEDAGVVTEADFADDINPGPVNANPQETGTVTFAVTQVSSSSTLTFTQAPAISPDGTLTFRAADNARGTATFNVIATDNGGASSVAQQFTITITPVNDPPLAVNDGPYRVFKQTVESTNGYTADPTLIANDSAGVDAGDPNETLRIVSASITTITRDPAAPTTATGAGLTVDVTGGTVRLRNTTPDGFFGQVVVTYTLSDRPDGDASGLTTTATATFNVVNFLPGFVSGRIWADSDGQGDIDVLNPPMGPERFLAGIEVYVTGTTQFGVPFSTMVRTNERGEYSLNDPSLPNGGLTPGTYTISLDNPNTPQIEAPELLSNGADTNGTSTVAGAITHLGNNTYRLSFNEEGVTVTNLNLAVLGLESQYVNIRDSLANSTSNGVVFGANMGAAAGSQMYWSSHYDGWNGMHDLNISITKNAAGTPVSAVITGRDTNNTLFTKTLSFTADYTKIRIMGMQGNNIVVRLVGTASDFFPTADLIAESAAPSGEGYEEAVDEIYSSYG